VGATALAAAPLAVAAQYSPLPSPAAPLSNVPPLGGGASSSTERVHHRVDAVTTVRVAINGHGAPFAVTATQSLDVRVTGDYFFTIGAPVATVEAAPGSDSAPGLRTASIVWAGFNPGRRTLAARATLDPARASAALPLRVEVSSGVTTLVNETAVTVGTIAAEADHIVTVSEHSKRDIIQLLGVEESRVTNTYEAVEFPPSMLERSDDEIAEQLRGSYRLDFRDYLLFYGALEPKKNVARLIDAYLLSSVDIPLVITGAVGWGNRAESKRLEELRAEARANPNGKRNIHHFEYASLPMLVTLIRGARAVLFPSLYEGFGLPVLEAMKLGTPVVTSRVSSLPEIAGDAALYVDPYDVSDIARAIKTIVADDGLRAELTQRGRAQSELFSLARYRERMADLYKRLV